MTSARNLDKVIAITGASAGIGRAVAELAAANGAAVVLSARRGDTLDEVVTGIAAAGGRAIAVPSDVTIESDMQRLVARAIETYGRLDVMICNAGIGYHHQFEATPTEAMRRLVDVNLMGTLYAAHAALAHFRARGSGHLIAISSIVGRRGIPGSALYSATKSAQIGLMEGIRAEVFGTDIHASLVYPIATATEFHAAIERDFGQETHGTGPKQTAAQVARAIVDCVEHPRAEVYPYRASKLLAVLSVIAPALADRFVQKYTRRAHAKGGHA
ncbi:MAG: SDR family NAD(P)-dependent oxidoreductase [Acidobacteria bacterium]|nr:SDR family NAD(P)-dependent oxidoreductase [Acidobacteriota bacterium]